ncbi:PEGA domain-containing protein [uncultured Methanospirillum sp.]|uniref:PEGA domain-containing protein n=1 Tax=uncultured Methanospirillum sp. TaxID=262503 RepID=UPI0029C80A5D|nr:PEGA domain-containing protein [uncultured Methanospirillum sp.]
MTYSSDNAGILWCFGLFLSLIFLFSSFCSADLVQATVNSSSTTLQNQPESSGVGEQSDFADNVDFDRGLMHFTSEQLMEFKAYRNQMPMVAASAGESLPTASKSLLSAVPYLGKKRDQGYCGNCWVWASTGAIEVTHSITSNVSDQLSIQYFNSNWNNGSSTGNACNGGWSYWVADFYNGTLHQAVPWSNTNASYADYYWNSGHPSGISASSIATAPNYPVSSASDTSLDVYQGQAQAINTIKSQINAGVPVIYTFYLPVEGWKKFRSFWRNESEAALWNPDPYNGTEIDGGHVVLIVGYDDTVNESYWTVLNSWGVRENRPSGLFRLKMDLNYNATLFEQGTEYYAQYFDIITTAFSSVSGLGSLSVSSNPSGASIWIDGKNTGYQTPKVITNITSGVHSLKLVKEWYFDHTDEFTICANQTTTISPTLPPEGALSVSSKPIGAEIWIDGSDTGMVTRSDIRSLSPGTHNLTLVKSGYANYTATFWINARMTTPFVALMDQTGGSIAVTSNPSGASVFVDQADTGYQTPNTITGLSPGTHTVLLKKDLYKDWAGAVMVAALNTTPIDTTLIPGGSNGSVFVSSTPSGGRITLDGLCTGYSTAKKIIGIPAGEHTITINKSGYQDWSGTATVRAGVTTTISGRLIP